MIFDVLLLSGVAGIQASCDQPVWRAEVRTRAAVDRALTDALHTDVPAEDEAVRERLSARIEAKREANTAFLLETAHKACMTRVLEEGDARTAFGFALIVSHSYTRPTDDPALAQRTRRWHDDWLEAGLINPVSYAQLFDRMRIVAGERQVYGTAIMCQDGNFQYDPPLADPDALEQRREELGWPQDAPPAPIGRPCGPAAMSVSEP